MSFLSKIQAEVDLKTLKTKFYNKTLTWEDMANLNRSPRTQDPKPFKERWVVVHGLLPSYDGGNFVILPTDAVWRDPLDAFGYYYMHQQKKLDSITDVKQGILIIFGNKPKEEAQKILQGTLAEQYKIIDRKYSKKLTSEETRELREDGIQDNRSDVTYFYFEK